MSLILWNLCDTTIEHSYNVVKRTEYFVSSYTSTVHLKLVQLLIPRQSLFILNSPFQVCVLAWCRPKLGWSLCCPNIRSVWVRRRPFLLWWMQGHSYSLLWAGCGWKSIAEVLSMIRERISAWYNLCILNHHISNRIFMEFFFAYIHVKLPVWWIRNGYWINICKQWGKDGCFFNTG